MGDPMKENDQGSGYQSWTIEESNELLKLMVDVSNRGWRDHAGKINKITVERHILKPLNEKLGITRTYNQYTSRVKYFRKQYAKYNELMRHNSGFGWNSVTKFFTADDEIWEDYFKSHRNNSSLRTDPHPDFENLRIAVGNGTAKGTYSIAIGDDTIEENRESGSLLDDFTYDPSSDAFIPSSTQDPFPPSPENSFVPTSTQQQYSEPRPPPRKRAKTDSQTKATSFDPKDIQDLAEKLTSNVEKFTRAIESIDTKEYNCWDLIK
ncbi:copper amine oxidase family protein, partial [Striga asiatica]